MKFLNVPITVEARKGVPCRIRRGRCVYTVRRLLDFWILQSRWWAREEKRVYFRLETDRGVVEVYRGSSEDRGLKIEDRGGRTGDRGSRGEDRGAGREGGEGGREERGGGREEGGEGEDGGSGSEMRGRRGGSTDGAERNHRGSGEGAPEFIEGDTHTRELRQTESPYRPDAAALAGRRLSEAHDSGVHPEEKREASPNADSHKGSCETPSPEARQTPGGSASSSISSREAMYRWVLSKVID